MKLSIIAILLLNAVHTIASGGYNVNMNNIDKLAEQHEYIALIEIENIYLDKIIISTIRQYKGKHKSKLKVFGNTSLRNVIISGNPNVKIGQKWIILATENSSVKFRRFQAKLYSTVDNFIDRSPHSGFRIEDRLHEIFKMKRIDIYNEILNRGDSKHELSYKNNKIECKKKYCYPNGKKYRIERYKNEKLEGKTIEYYRNGEKSKIYNYRMDTIYSIKTFGADKKEILTTKFGEFKEMIYGNNIKTTILTSERNSSNKLIHKIKRSKYKDGKIEYYYDEYLDDLTRFPDEIRINLNIELQNQAVQLGPRREVVSVEIIEIDKKPENLITFLEYDVNWNPLDKKIVFYTPSLGIFKEVHPDNEIYIVENQTEIKKVIAKTDEIINKI